jgi:hypothetical protein
MTDPILARITGILRDTAARYPDDVARAVYDAIKPELDALARVQALADECDASGRSSGHPLTVTRIRAALDTSQHPPAATQATDTTKEI